MPTIITDHIANVKTTSVARHGASISIPILPVATADAANDDVIVRCR